MDPITLATITSAASNLGLEAIRDSATEAVQELWDTIKQKLGWQQEPDSSELAPEIARRLQNDEELTRELVKLLQNQSQPTYSGALVKNIDADKVTLADTVNIHGDLNMTGAE